MNPLGVDKVLCLSLDTRETIWGEFLLTALFAKDWTLEAFVVGDGLNEDLKYNLVDNNELPPSYSSSTTYPTWWNRPNAYNAWKSHKAMMEKCLKEGLESVLFVEDDCVFTEDYEQNLPLIEKFARHHEWDMFYLGSFFKKSGLIMVDPNVIQLNGNGGGWHAVALKKKVMEKLLQFPPFGPFDWICQQYLQKSMNCYAAYPPLMRQQGGFSYIEGHYLGRRKEDNYQ